MAGSGLRVESPGIGRLIVMAAGAGTILMAGHGFHTSRGAGCRIIMGGGRFGAAAGAGFRWLHMVGAGLRIMWFSLGGAITTIGMVTEMDSGMGIGPDAIADAGSVGALSGLVSRAEADTWSGTIRD